MELKEIFVNLMTGEFEIPNHGNKGHQSSYLFRSGTNLVNEIYKD